MKHCISSLRTQFLILLAFASQVTPPMYASYQVSNKPGMPFLQQRRDCPCPPSASAHPLVACNILADTINTSDLTVNASACFNGPVTFCGSVKGGSNSVLEGLWIVVPSNQIPGPGETRQLEPMLARAFNCVGTEVQLQFNTTTDDPAHAFSMLKTIQACDVIRLTQIDLSNPCPIVHIVNTQAVTGVTGCGNVLTISVFDAPGISEMYNDLGSAVSLINFGPAVGTPAKEKCACWTAVACSGLMATNSAAIIVPTSCLAQFNSGILLTSRTFDTGTDEYILVFNPITKDGSDVLCRLASVYPGDTIRLSETDTDCQSYIELGVGTRLCVADNANSGVAFQVIPRTVTSSIVGANCVCLDNLGPIPPLKSCWNFRSSTCILANPDSCIAQFSSLGNLIAATAIFSAISGILVNSFDAEFFNNNALFNSIGPNDCIRLFSPNSGLGGVYGTYQIITAADSNQTINQVEYNSYHYTLIYNPDLSSGVIVPDYICLEAYGPCCIPE